MIATPKIPAGWHRLRKNQKRPVGYRWAVYEFGRWTKWMAGDEELFGKPILGTGPCVMFIAPIIRRVRKKK